MNFLEVIFSKQAAKFWMTGGALLMAWLSFTTVYLGHIGVVTLWGRPVAEFRPGAHFILPFAESVVPVDMQTRTSVPDETASSKDLQIVHTRATLQYHVEPGYATYMLTQLNGDFEARVVTPAIVESVKATTARYDASELITQRPKVRDGIEDAVKARLALYHLIAENVSITSFNFSDEYNQAIEAKVTAQQRAEKAENDLRRIQIEAQQQVAQAQGEAEALKSQKEQITPELLQLRMIEMLRDKWDGKLPVTVAGGSVPMLDILKASAK